MTRDSLKLGMTRHGFTLKGMGGNLSAYCRPAVFCGRLHEERVILSDMDPAVAPTRLRDRVRFFLVNLTEEEAGDITPTTYRDYARYTGQSAAELVRSLDRIRAGGVA